jgi:hypothetical protein
MRERGGHGLYTGVTLDGDLGKDISLFNVRSNIGRSLFPNSFPSVSAGAGGEKAERSAGAAP